MSPVNRHFQVVEINDFSPGLWETSDWLMPSSGAQEMSDCYPQAGGGLRAFFKGDDLSVSGITDITKERVIGLFAFHAGQRSFGVGDGIDRYLLTYDNSSGAVRPRLYRMDGSNNETTWTQVYVTSGTTLFNVTSVPTGSPLRPSFVYFKDSSAVEWIIVTVPYSGSSPGGPGIYKLAYATASSSLKAIEMTTGVTGSDRPSGSLATHQARIVVADEDTIVWTNAGTITFAAANFLPVEPNQLGADIVALHASPPGDLLVLKNGAPMAVVQGDITDPTVVGMNEAITGSGSSKQEFGVTPDGLSFIARDGHVYLTNGSSVENISQQIGDFALAGDFAGMGDTNFFHEFLFAPDGYVFHLPTKSWFKQTRMAGKLHNVSRADRMIWGPVGTGTSFTLRSITPVRDRTRMNTYSWKSAPLRSPDGRQIEVREVEIVAKSYDASATIAVTVNGTTVTKTLSTTGKQDVSFLFKQRAEVLDVRVVPTAGNSANEAPSIEAVRIYSRSGHQTY